MACCPPQNSEDGFATPIALVLSLALAVVASTMVWRSTAQLRLARADLERSQAEYLLDGAHLAAAATIVRNNRMGPFAWAFTSDVGWVDAVAQPEATKLSLEAASRMEEAVIARFAVADPAQLRRRLAQAASTRRVVDIATLDDAVLWRTCAPSIISSLGRATTVVAAIPEEPGPGPNPASWRIGEEWRVSLTTTTGWRDDRIVRFTGDARHPTAVIVRKLSRGEGEGGKCEEVFQGLTAANAEMTATP